MAEITMPQLGETVTEGTITKWLKNVGEKIDEDEVIYEVSTDKVDSEVPSPVAGYLAEIKVAEGETAEVGAVLAVVSDSPPDGSAQAAPAAAATSGAEPPPADEGGGGDPEPMKGTDAAAATPAPEPQPIPAPASEPASAETREPAPSPNGGDGSRLLSPVVRRLVSEHNLDPSSIKGSGQGGRITRNDVLAVIDGRGSMGGGREEATVSAPSRTPAKPEAPGAPDAEPQRERVTEAPVSAGDRDEVVAFSNIRRRTAEHMVRSLDTSAHTLVVIDVDYQNVDKVRNDIKDRFRAEEGIGLNYLPFIARAVIDAIHEYPYVNASVGNDELIVHHYVNLGVAVDLNFQGLIVPVVRDADSKRLRAIAREIAELANRARGKKLGADDITGGTFTLTNAGPYGTLLTAPVINQPQVAILATDGIKPRPVAIPMPDGTYGIAVHPVGNLALSFDHRAYDGAYASAFVAKVKEILETRDWSAEV